MLKNFPEQIIQNETDLHNTATHIQLEVLKKARERKYMTKEGLSEYASNEQLADQVRTWLEENLSSGIYTSTDEMTDDCLKIFFQPPNKNGFGKYN